MAVLTHRALAEKRGLVIVPVADLSIVPDSAGGYTNELTGRPVGKRRSAQIAALVLPPKWSDVRIASNPKAHIQAVGSDAAGRLQYRYHEDWTGIRDIIKVQRLLAFGRSLPDIRAAVARDLRKGIGTRAAVTATAVRLIDRQLVRVGGEAYAKAGTVGAATLRPGHVDSTDGTVDGVSFTGKAGKKIDLTIRDRQLSRRLAALKRTNRRRLFRYETKAGRRASKRNLQAADINAYLRRASGRGVSAKDFRTFGASALAVELLCGEDDTPSARRISGTMKAVSKKLRNTPAVARSSYVHPVIVKAFEAGELDKGLMQGRKRDGLSESETALMRLLESHRSGNG